MRLRSSAIVLFTTTLLIGSVSSLGGRGTNASLTLIAARSSDLHTLHATDPITLWCSPDNPQVVITSAKFTKVSDNQQLDAELSPKKNNATHTFGSPSIKDAGEYRCELETPHGKIKHSLFIFARPIVHTHEHFTEKQGNAYHLEGTGNTIEKGESVNLTCPVTGYPKPTVRWVKNGAPLALSKTVSIEGGTVRIVEADYADAGSYSCEAINEYTTNQKTSKLLLVVDKMLDVRSEYQWVYPLAVILITLLLLVIIIVACELRNKKRATKN